MWISGAGRWTIVGSSGLEVEEAVELGLGGFRGGSGTRGSCGGGFLTENPFGGFEGGFATGGGKGLRCQFVWEAHA